ncbi:MAG: xanthine dehydrogenase family protein subunit M [Nonomuraea sp.]|nr:xanthine dehydrogenase family protein subunit M [Nonomuraea sp.]
MKPPPFEHHAPRSVGEALDVLAETGGHGKVLAGGQSLIPMLNMRLAAPAHLVDINGIAALETITVTPEGVTVGALARHAQVERADVPPILRQALRLVAHPVIRNRGTVVGSLVHADPAAELPAVLAVLGGTVRLARRGEAELDVPAARFFVGPMESSVEPRELAVSAFFPALPAGSGTAFVEVARRHGDYALAGVCAVVTPHWARVACIGVGAVPVVVDVTGADGPAAAEVVRAAVDPEDDIHASADYRRHLVGVLTERALREAAA